MIFFLREICSVYKVVEDLSKTNQASTAEDESQGIIQKKSASGGRTFPLVLFHKNVLVFSKVIFF